MLSLETRTKSESELHHKELPKFTVKHPSKNSLENSFKKKIKRPGLGFFFFFPDKATFGKPCCVTQSLAAHFASLNQTALIKKTCSGITEYQRAHGVQAPRPSLRHLCKYFPFCEDV